MASEPKSAAALVVMDRGCGRDHLAGDEPGLRGELVDDLERAGDAFGGIDHDRDDRNVPAELEQFVAVRGVSAVEPPDSAQAGRTACVGALSELADERA